MEPQYSNAATGSRIVRRRRVLGQGRSCDILAAAELSAQVNDSVFEGILGVELNTRLFLSSSGLADLGGLGDPWHDSVVLSFHFLKGHAACEIPWGRVAVASCDVCFVADHATAATAANASALQAVGARALQEALAAELSPLDG